jgi:nicotinamide-nucleotide amidase
MDAEIIAVGSELLTPEHADTNSLYLTARLNHCGILVRFKNIVGDSKSDLAVVLRGALERSPLIVLTGGLGPTEDDLTREVVAEVLGRPLHEVAELRQRLEDRFVHIGRAMPQNNLRQVQVPEGAEWLENRNGTAPGIWIEHKDHIIVLLPGPPRELEPLFDATCVPRLERLASGARIRTRVYKVVGLPESEVDQLIAPLYGSYQNPATTILASLGTIEVHLRARAATEQEAEAQLAELGDKIELALGDHVYSTKGESLEEVVGMYLVMRQKTLAVGESCTGGLLAERITRVSGSSGYFLGGAVCYTNEMKTRWAGVPADVISAHGAVSKTVARALAEGVRARAGASIGVGITGIAGPTGGTNNKPVGLVYVALADERGTQVREFHFPGSRDRVRHWATQMALEMVRRRIKD